MTFHRKKTRVKHINKFNGINKKVLIIATGGKIVECAKQQCDPQNISHALEHYMKIDAVFQQSSVPRYDIIQWSNLVPDGSIEVSHMIKIAIEIEKFYLEDYDGFVILTNVKTMAYTASYLSFMIENLQKPIVLTDAYCHLMDMFTDARANMLASMIVAGHTNIHEVCVCWNKKIFRGNRITRCTESSVDHFVSHNYPLIGSLEPELSLTNLHKQNVMKKRFRVFTNLVTNIVVIHLTPLLTEKMLRCILFASLKKYRRSSHTCNDNRSLSSPTIANISKQSFCQLIKENDSPSINTNADNSYTTVYSPTMYMSPHFSSLAMMNSNESPPPLPMLSTQVSVSSASNMSFKSTLHAHNELRKGVILSFFGMGNGPEKESFRELLREALESYNCEIVITAQPAIGTVNLSMYGSGKYFSNIGLISAMDMTTESAVAKLAYLMGKGFNGLQLKQEFERDLRGELTEDHVKKQRIVKYKTSFSYVVCQKNGKSIIMSGVDYHSNYERLQHSKSITIEQSIINGVDI